MEQFIKYIYIILIAIIVGLLIYSLVKLIGISKSLTITATNLDKLNNNIELADQKKLKINETKEKLRTFISTLVVVSVVREFIKDYKHSRKIGKTVRKTLVSNAGKIAKINIK